MKPRTLMDQDPTRWAWRFKAGNIEATARTFEGLANTWNLDLGGDVVLPGAFKRTLGRWRKSGRIIPLLDSHDGFSSVTSVVGKMIDAKETQEGLWSKFEVIADDRGDAILRRIEGGFVDALSIGYRPVKMAEPDDSERRSGVWRKLEEVELREVSVVVFPMNTESRIDAASVKTLLEEADALLQLQDPTEEEKAELLRLRGEIDELAAKTAEPEGLAPDSSARIAQDALLRGLKLSRIVAPAHVAGHRPR